MIVHFHIFGQLLCTNFLYSFARLLRELCNSEASAQCRLKFHPSTCLTNIHLLRLYSCCRITLMDAGVIILWIFALSEVLLNCVFCSIPADSETLDSCFFHACLLPHWPPSCFASLHDRAVTEAPTGISSTP